VRLHRALPAEELFTSCEPTEWILLPIVVMEFEHLVQWNCQSRPAGKFHVLAGGSVNMEKMGASDLKRQRPRLET
jgi:hypothetical protein